MSITFGAPVVDLDALLIEVVRWACERVEHAKYFTASSEDSDVRALLSRVCRRQGLTPYMGQMDGAVLDVCAADGSDQQIVLGHSDIETARLLIHFAFAEQWHGSADPFSGDTLRLANQHVSGYYVESSGGRGAAIGLLARPGNGWTYEAFDAMRQFTAFRTELLIAYLGRLRDTLELSLTLSDDALNEIGEKNVDAFLDRHSVKRIAQNVRHELFDYRLRGRVRRQVQTREAVYRERQKRLRSTFNRFLSTSDSAPILERLASSSIRTKVGLLIAGAGTFGGLEQWVCDIARQLKTSGYLPYLIVQEEPRASCRVAEEFPGETVYLGLEDGALQRVADQCKLEALVVNHAYQGLAELRQGPYVVEVLHNIYFWHKDSQFIADARQRVDRFIAVSNVAATYATELLNLPSNKIEVIPHGLNAIGLYRAQLPFLRRRLDTGAFTVLCVGNIYPQKNIICLVRAFARFKRDVPSAKLHLVGGPAEMEFVSNVRQEVETHGLQGDVLFLGSLGRRALSREYCQAHLFVLPSLYEGYGLVSLEAQYFGLPMVLSNTGYASELLKDNDIGGLAHIALPLSMLSADSVREVSFDPPETSVQALYTAMAKVHADYERYVQAGLDVVATSRTVDIVQSSSAFIDMLRRNGVS